MVFSFNLIDQAWIPVVDLDGNLHIVNIRELLINAHQYRQLGAGMPHTNAALYRLLLAILHRIFGPEDTDAWAELWVKKQFEAGLLDNYLQKWYSRFDLFAADHPFFQRQNLNVKIKPANALLFLVAGGNAETLFDHNIDDRPVKLTPAQAALALVTAQTFNLAGLCYPQLKLEYTDAPCARAAVFLLQGKNLFESLMLNLVEYTKASPIRWMPGVTDLPAWEMDDPYLPERTAPMGYLDYLTWQNRRIMLFPSLQNGEISVNQVSTAPGLVLSAEQRNPMHHYRIDEKAKDNQSAFKVLRFTEGHALWRDSSALLNPAKKNVERPATLNWAEKLITHHVLPHSKLTLVAYGMSTDPGKQKVYFYRGEEFEFPDELLTNEQLAIQLDQALQVADNLRSQLWGTVNNLATLIISAEADLKGGRKPDANDVKQLISHWNAEGLYWSALELPFYRFLNHLPDQPETALSDWEKELRRAALNAFDHTVNLAGSNIRAVKASAKAHQQLLAGLKKVLTPTKEEDMQHA